MIRMLCPCERRAGAVTDRYVVGLNRVADLIDWKHDRKAEGLPPVNAQRVPVSFVFESRPRLPTVDPNGRTRTPINL